MIILISSLVILGLFAALLGIISQRKGEKDDVKTADDCSSCNGANDKCEQECMMEAAIKDIEYFNDEELDTFKGRDSNSYSDEEVEQFEEVLYTLKTDEIKDWNRSIALRGINIPDQLKDELIMMMEG